MRNMYATIMSKMKLFQGKANEMICGYFSLTKLCILP